MKSFKRFLDERIRAMMHKGKLLSDKSLYIGMAFVNQKSKMVYYPVVHFIDLGTKNETEIAFAYPLEDQKKINLVYQGEFKKLGSKMVPLDWNKLLGIVHKDTKL